MWSGLIGSNGDDEARGGWVGQEPSVGSRTTPGPARLIVLTNRGGRVIRVQCDVPPVAIALKPRSAVTRPPPSGEERSVHDKLLTVDQVAETLNTTPRFVRRLIAERRICFHHLGRHVRILESDVDAFVAAGRVSERAGSRARRTNRPCPDGASQVRRRASVVVGAVAGDIRPPRRSAAASARDLLNQDGGGPVAGPGRPRAGPRELAGRRRRSRAFRQLCPGMAGGEGCRPALAGDLRAQPAAPHDSP